MNGSSVPAGPSSGAPTGPTSAPPTESAPATAAAPTTTAPSDTRTSLTLRFGDREIRATLEDSAASRSLLAQLPATLDFSDYGGQEKIATLSAPLDLTGATDRAAAPAGTLGYYAPDQGLVLYYESVGAYSGIVPLGVFDDVDALRDASDGSVEVRVQ
ncbi:MULTISPECIES: cyclophilin-like fold protein [unclassified Rathayibacter]|uniref:cyclophilin-like fold protein n=1 Tax=unclassified Rathayibacter TaxID=2609250 RepID=UPI001FB37147|nr:MULTISPECIES: cyclophilin-like fold protein [unclassified Rathayibacter]MCJ1674600.1 cyclophilin-like fold protein [Rathayibacter sp. VKM Ac-2929]MCJ1684881.1 cyclophilin-like fold protein [Rathayibacter sp. VKM Ac-2928]